MTSGIAAGECRTSKLSTAMNSLTRHELSDRPSLIYVSPIVPALTGNGLAMRAAHVLLALSRWYRVTLLVAVRYASPSGQTVPEEIAGRCREVVVVPGSAALQATIALRDAPFDVVHVFRIAAVEYARPYLETEPAPRRWLDLDDVESTKHRRIAALHRRHRDPARARTEEEVASAALRAENDVLPRFDRVYVCAEHDVERLPRSVRSRATVLPNAVAVPEQTLPPPERDPVEILFVGTLSYYPNEEGITWFAEQVLPLVRLKSGRQVVLRIAGRTFAPLVRALEAVPGIDFTGYVPDLLEWYERCLLVVVPIRAGGGTRIKVLEAFAMRRPVVATTIGAEGIAARHGEHLLLADDPKSFAASCARLIEEPALGERLATNAYALFSERYTFEALARIVAPGRGLPPR
jgi:glycosyltransferase involved in cell wall biosynthesis